MVIALKKSQQWETWRWGRMAQTRRVTHPRRQLCSPTQVWNQQTRWRWRRRRRASLPVQAERRFARQSWMCIWYHCYGGVTSSVLVCLYNICNWQKALVVVHLCHFSLSHSQNVSANVSVSLKGAANCSQRSGTCWPSTGQNSWCCRVRVFEATLSCCSHDWAPGGALFRGRG